MLKASKKNTRAMRLMHLKLTIKIPEQLMMLSFIIVIFSIVVKVNRVKRQYLTLLYLHTCWWLLC